LTGITGTLCEDHYTFMIISCSFLLRMIYLLTAVGFPPGGSSTVHIYTQTIHRVTQNKQYVEQHKNFGRVQFVPRLCGLYPGICLTTEEKAWKNLIQGDRRVPAGTMKIHKHTGYTQKNGAVSKVNKKFISHLTRAQRTPSAAATVRVSHALTLRRLMSYIYGAPILDVSRSHTTTQHSR